MHTISFYCRTSTNVFETRYLTSSYGFLVSFFFYFSYMFWTDWGSPGKVERAYMDGSGRMTLADTGLVWPNDVTVDFAVSPT